jgi:tetratricopeptide (TPR) repeat protein
VKKIFILLIVFLVLFFTVFLLWYSDEPSTQLVDASGRPLTAGGEIIVSGDHSDSPFDAVRAQIADRAFDEAREKLLQLIETTDADGEACLLLSDVSRELKERDAALDYGLKAVTLLPDSAEAHLAYAKALGLQLSHDIRSFSGIFGAMKRISLFKETIERVIELDPEDTEARMILAFYYMAPRPIGDLDRALEVSKEIEARDPIKGKQMRALCLHQMEKTEEAIQLCLDTLEEHPEARRFHITLARIYEDEERFDDADQAFEAARQGDRDEAYYHSLYFQALMRVNNEFEAERAVSLFDAFIEGDPKGDDMPSVAYALLRKGNALEQLDRLTEAKAAYEEALRLEPDFEPGKEALEELGE